MALLMMDLDNTLIDRDAAFREAVIVFLSEKALPASDLGWVLKVDGSGFTPRPAVAAAMIGRFPGADALAVERLLDDGGAGRVTLAPTVAAALRAIPWPKAIVTNGRTVQQHTKLVNSGLDRLADAWVISEEAGCRKPSPEIFQLAARRAGVPLDGAWMVGDSAGADVSGPVALGLTTVWVANGREWTERAYRPTHVAADIDAALALVANSGPAVSA
ncbi:HAD family hydrolase [Actinoplanes rectilineatus]|uniref:HAD family hydrolase n=1 Tax=Actinoplanes rectilineatus TaxID=113571 RepID=UPI0005F2913B|nr:HAD family hydrolase [Actinoplanes rectilineatus]